MNRVPLSQTDSPHGLRDRESEHAKTVHDRAPLHTREAGKKQKFAAVPWPSVGARNRSKGGRICAFDRSIRVRCVPVNWLFGSMSALLKKLILDPSGPVALSWRVKCAFKPPSVRKRPGFSIPILSVGGTNRSRVWMPRFMQGVFQRVLEHLIRFSPVFE